MSSPSSRHLVCAMLLLVLGCKSTEPPEDTAPVETSSEVPVEAAPDSQPASQPAARAEAPALARDIFESAGGPAWPEVTRVLFTFVVESEGERVFEAAHDWDVAASTDRVVWSDREGRAHDVTVDLETRAFVSGTIDQQPIAADARADEAQAAHARWINDAYWLLKPIKVLDPGVTTTALEPRQMAGVTLEPLELRFDGVGLTPGDRYVLLFDRAQQRVVGWQMQLEGQDALGGVVTWADHASVGPLTLPMTHVTSDGTRRILFEGVTVETSQDDDAGK